MKKHTEQHTDSEANTGRRKAVKRLLVGGGVIGATAHSEKWTRPVMDSVVLPTHARMTLICSPPE